MERETAEPELDAEEVLLPGNVTSVVRVGDTVRRRTGPNSAAVHALLQHLQAAGFDGAPAFHGIDSNGREILDYIQGESLHALEYDEPALHRVGARIRQFHDATTGFELPPGLAWHDPPEAGAPATVVCHNDLAPRNTVIRPGDSIVFIDWDGAAQAPCEWDLAHAVWQYAYIGPVAIRERGPAESERRISALLDGYGPDAFDPDLVARLYIPVTQRTLEAIARYLADGTLVGDEPQGWMSDIRSQQAWARENASWLLRAVWNRVG